MIQGKRDSKGIFTDEGELSSKGMTILHQLLSDSASAHHSTGTKNLQLNPLRVHEPLAIEFRPTGEVSHGKEKGRLFDFDSPCLQGWGYNKV